MRSVSYEVATYLTRNSHGSQRDQFDTRKTRQFREKPSRIGPGKAPLTRRPVGTDGVYPRPHLL